MNSDIEPNKLLKYLSANPNNASFEEIQKQS